MGDGVMERMTKRENGHVYYPRCFEEPCGGMGCLTEDCGFKVEICERLAAYEDTGLEPDEVNALQKDWSDLCTVIGECGGIARLRELAEADKDGRLVVLPCKVGDTVYFALLGRIIEKQVFSIVSFSNSTRIYCGGTSEYFRPEDIGKTFFLTREEAEKALEAMKDD
jgi:hypothetical protein